MDRIVLHAADGMVYTDGSCGGKTIYLAVGENAENWYQIPQAEYQLTVEGGFGMAAEADYRAALKEFGVNV